MGRGEDLGMRPGSASIWLHVFCAYRVQTARAVLLVRLLRCPFRLRLQKPLFQHQCLLNVLLANPVERLIEPRYTVTLTSPITLDSTPKSVNNSLPLRWQDISHSSPSWSQEALAWGSSDGLARNESTIHAAAPSPAAGIHVARFTDTHAQGVCQFEVRISWQQNTSLSHTRFHTTHGSCAPTDHNQLATQQVAAAYTKRTWVPSFQTILFV